jgi:hypothetical protein
MNVSTALPADTTTRYAIYEEIGSGGMATVHLGRRLGPVSFSRMVAIKRLHAHLARDPEVVTMFLDEARLAARVRHPNVVPTLDVNTEHGQPFLVMEYVVGESLARLTAALQRRGERISVPIACSIVVGMLHGLHAAHEATNERGGSLGIVHRDVSPQNVMVGLDGVTRVFDFGVAKAVGRLQTTREGQFKGKLAYTAPELVRGGRATRAADIYSAGVVLWEMLTGQRLFAGDNEASVLERVLFARVTPPSGHTPGVASSLDAIVLRALVRDPARRFATASEMARAVEAIGPAANPTEVGDWVGALAGDALAERAQKIAKIDEGVTPFGELDADAVLDEYASGDVPKSAAVAGARGVRGAPRWRPALTLAMLGVALTVAIAGLARLRHRAPETHADVRPLVAATNPSPELPAPAASPPAVQPPTVSADDLPTATPNPRRAVPATTVTPPSTQRNRASGATASPPKPAREAPGAGAAAQPAATSKPGCDPPWKIDANGIKQYKLECL